MDSKTEVTWTKSEAGIYTACINDELYAVTKSRDAGESGLWVIYRDLDRIGICETMKEAKEAAENMAAHSAYRAAQSNQHAAEAAASEEDVAKAKAIFYRQAGRCEPSEVALNAEIAHHAMYPNDLYIPFAHEEALTDSEGEPTIAQELDVSEALVDAAMDGDLQPIQRMIDEANLAADGALADLITEREVVKAQAETIKTLKEHRHYLNDEIEGLQTLVAELEAETQNVAILFWDYADSYSADDVFFEQLEAALESMLGEKKFDDARLKSIEKEVKS